MNLLKLVSILIFSLFAADTAVAQGKAVRDGQRQVELELEEVDGATAYEIELTSKGSGKKQLFKMKTPMWRAAIRPGDYSLKLRAHDARGVPGAWSEAMPFTVKLPGPALLEPTLNAEIKTNEEKTFEVNLKWAAVPGTKSYRLDIAPKNAAESTDEVVSKTFSTNSAEITLPVAKAYQWTVTPISKSGEEGEKQDEPGQFNLIGKALESPKIEKPEDIWVQEIVWKKPDYTEKFNYTLQRKTEDNKWENVDAKADYTEIKIDFPLTLPGGQYRFGVKAEALGREPSKMAQVEFKVSGGDRSPAAVEEAKLRQSLEKPTPWYFTASWLVTAVNYTGINPQGGFKTHNYATEGGTGRLGLGYISQKNNSGFLGIIDMSGLIVEGSNVTYASAELHYIKRYSWGRNMLRPSAGFFYKELPETRDRFTEPNKYFSEMITYGGPHIGFDFWRPISSKLGFQINTRLYYGMLDLGTPNGLEQEAQMSFQMGIMGSYKIKPNITGFLGWAHREDTAKYKATPFGGSIADSVPGVNGTQFQEVRINGDYLNLLLEWGF